MPEKWTESAAYEAYVGRWSRKVGAAFLTWLDPPSGARWLDLGCGTGALTTQILDAHDPRGVIAVDPSEEFLALARQQVRDDRVEFRNGAGEAIPLPDGEVDIAVSGLVLNFVADPEKTTAELARTARPGGTVASFVWDYAGHVQFMRYFWDAAIALDPAAREKDQGVQFPLCRPGPLRALFEDAGLRGVTVAPIDIPTPFADFEDFWTPFLSGVSPAPAYCAGLDDESRNRLEARLRETLPTDADGIILLAARAWAVRGTR